ncbi:hypothetical protein AGABI1DRAFT_118454 [Agaricus bisporus var. burnettii JB137-S8]|uniref:Trafficking protein particle complex subunit 11 domain-containing protein n=2 Tax=Agaricus bisporus var. burnettii TaxID=192524 RepID=K5X5C3_AGABU|nr:uncharacterized protein AGABI1DRAFT_118454 [Agaricus bisporus var. burnettii JB137-S8]EKM83061.1 hypothetical protein AGABI1DRAFT_118454 [Agaricus bisporus var. burnettii JB137-S8]KAF7777572.1 hypothetical protein Agabi119p4_3644 [Agaricus bisporus var. burnettii]
MAENRVIVTYTTASSLLSTETWKQIHAALKVQFPLRNIHWKPASGSSILTIQELDVKLVPFENVRDEHASQIPMTLLEKPLLHIYVVACEPGDLETYKNSVKRQVKDWHNSVVSRKNQEWLILHLVKGDTPLPSGKLFQLKGSVLDKLRTDFNQDKRDRCIQVTWSTTNDKPSAWGEFANKVKDSLMTAFDAAVSQREEEVRRSESQQSMPGWNFCTFFILKESLASSYEGMNFFEEALIQFEELEELFNHIWTEKNFSWFGTLIDPGPDDDTLPLLSVSKKPYRDLILASNISVFDLRTYLLTRQCELLAKLGRIGQIAVNTSSFLARFGQRLRAAADTLPLYFVESWIYSSSLSVAQQYDAWFPPSPDGSKPSPLYASKGELYENAWHQLNVIGVDSGHLPAKPPFCMKLRRESNPHKRDSKTAISNKDLREIIHDREAFFKMYIDVTNRAISMYTKAGRRKSALKLHGTLAALDLHREQYSAALTTYSSLPAHYSPHTWTALESYMLSRALDAHAEMDQPKDNEWMHNLLSYLKSLIEHKGDQLLIHEDDKAEYISQMVSLLTQTTHDLDSEIEVPGHQIFSIEIMPEVDLAESQDGAYINPTVTNRLSCSLPIDDITVTVTGRESEKYEFTAPATVISPGCNALRLFCPAISMGKYLIRTTKIRVGNLVFHWDHRKVKSSNRWSNTIIRVPQDTHALSVTLDQSPRIELGKSPAILVTISTGRNNINHLRLRLGCPNIVWKYDTAVSQGEGIELESEGDSLVLRGLKEAGIYSLSLPHSDTSTLHDLKINIEAEYDTEAQPSITRKLSLTRVLFTTLPMSVNVQDFFRESRLISKFTISTTSHQHIRIASAALEMPLGGIDGVTIASPSSSPKVVTVTPMQPANFIFFIDSASGAVHESLTLVIKYCLLRAEVRDLIEKEVEAVMEEDESRIHYVSLINHLIQALGNDASWVELYGVTGELVIPDMPQDSDSDFGGKLLTVKENLARHQHPQNFDSTEQTWREIRIPVDIPQMHIVAAARMSILATPFGSVNSNGTPSLYAGQPISTELKISTSFRWGPNRDDQNQSFMMRYNVEETIRDWLISGPKRGEFIAKENGSFTTQITLLALHHGELPLPKINVSALPVAGDTESGSISIPSAEVFQVHGAEKVLILPRGGRSTFVVGTGSTQ